MEKFDLVIIGAGPGGYVAAIRAAQLGLNAAIVEKEPVLGGTCLRVGCIPSKALLESSELFSHMKDGLSEHGIHAGAPEIDVATMQERKSGIVRDLTGGIGLLLKKNKVSVFYGTAKLTGGQNVLVEGGDKPVELQADSILIATGSAPVELPHIPFDGETVISSTEALSLDRVPKHLIVIGGGAIGLELGSVWRRLGAEVTVVEMMPMLVPFADKQLSQMLQRSLKQQGLDIRLKTQVTKASVSEEGVTVTLKDAKDKESEISGDKLLVAVGRRPFTDGLGLESVGIQRDERGRIPVNEQYMTSTPGIYAIGDVVVGPMLAHKASEEGVAVVELIAGKAGHVNYGTIPNVVYTHPELAQVGLTEEEAKEKGHEVKVGKFFFKSNGRAKTMAETDGLTKVVSDAKTDKVLGVHILGPHASELIHEAVLGLEFSASTEDIARTTHAHPTLAEVLKEAALAVDKRAIHG